MNIINPNEITKFWSREAIEFLVAEWKWKTQEIETRLKSPYPLLFIYNEQEMPLQPNTNP
jgi:hypothetical protein